MTAQERQQPGNPERQRPGDGKVFGATDVPQENGLPGTVALPAADVLQADTLLHRDTTGTAQKELLDLAGSFDTGFAAAWRDGRDGNLGLYFALIGSDGRQISPDRSVQALGRSGRQLDPEVTLGTDGAGAIVWRDNGDPNIAFHCRLFGRDGTLQPSQRGLGTGSMEQEARGRARRDVLPAVAIAADKSALCTWNENGSILQQIVKADGPGGAPNTLNKADRAADGRPVIACAPDGSWLCAWPAGGTIEFLQKSSRGAEDRGTAGPGTPLKLAYDASSSGWWLLVDHAGARVLRRLSKTNAVDLDAVAPVAAPRSILDFASSRSGLIVLAGGGGEGTSIEVLFLTPRGEPSGRAPFLVRPDEGVVIGVPRVAATDGAALLAWSERSGGEFSVRCRLLPEKGEPQKSVVLTHDQATANQSDPALASAGGDLAVAAWIDGRVMPAAVMAQRLAAKGGFIGDELRLPAAFAGKEPELLERGGPSEPAVAVDARGNFLVSWSENVPGGGAGQRMRVRAQAFDRDARPLGADVVIDEGLPPGSFSDLAALGSERGWGVVWSRGKQGIQSRRLELDGTPAGPGHRISVTDDVGMPSLAALQGSRIPQAERLVAVWHVTVPQVGRRLRARLLDRDLAPQGGELAFDTMYRASDYDPCVAPTNSGGFAIAWTTGEQRDRDIFARAFDAQGRPASRPFAISVRAHEQDVPSITLLGDGSLAVAWEDDISYYDFVYVRRIARDLASLGPTATLCERPEEYLHQHVRPHVAAVDTGLLALWGDCRRSQGTDVFWKVLGPRFDEAREGRPGVPRDRK